MLRPTALLACAAWAAAPATAATLELSPVLVQVISRTGGATTISLKSRSPEDLRLQLRVLRWQQNGVGEQLEPTRDVVASPPFVVMRPATEYIVRVARLSKTPVVGEESYRLLIDELPAPEREPGVVTLAMRHALPVFFVDPAASPAAVTWRAHATAAGLALIGTNSGRRRLRIANPVLVLANGERLPLATGLLGYVLGGRSMQWTLGGITVPLAIADARIAFRSETKDEQAPLAFDSVPK